MIRTIVKAEASIIRLAGPKIKAKVNAFILLDRSTEVNAWTDIGMKNVKGINGS